MWARLFLASFLLVFLLVAAPPAGRAEQLSIRSYSTADGLASDTVYRVVVDSRGSLWFCTSDGVSRFDGYAFVSYATTAGLPTRQVSDVLSTSDGVVWVATSKGLCRFDPNGRTSGTLFVPQSLGDDPAANEVDCVRETLDGALWCGTQNGLVRLEARTR